MSIKQIINCIKRRDIASLQLLHGDPIDCCVAALRGAIVPTPGKRLLVWDFGQIEARCLAWLADDQQLLSVFADGGDPYRVTAASIYNKPTDNVTDAERFIGKQAVLGLGYGMGAAKFKSQLANMWQVEVSEEFARHVVTTYRSTHPNIQNLWRMMERNAINCVKTGQPVSAGNVTWELSGIFLKAILPSRRAIFYPNPKLTEPKARKPGWAPSQKLTYDKFEGGRLGRVDTYGGKLVENVTQGMARDVMVAGMFGLRQAGLDILATVHDEIIGESATMSVEQGKKILEVVPSWCPGLPLLADGFEAERYRK